MRSFLVAALCLAVSVTTSINVRAQEPKGERSFSDEVETDLPIGPLLLGSFGAVVVAVGAGFGWQAKQEYDDFNKKEPSPQPGQLVYSKATNDLSDDIRAHSIAANILMFSGVAAVAGGLIWWLVGKKNDTSESGDSTSTVEKSASLTPLLGPGHAGISVQF